MGTAAFSTALAELIESAKVLRSAIMCAESLPWRCHRSLIADALLARGIEVEHLLKGGSRLHTFTACARTDGWQVTYPSLL
jgi:uncharacterized protein (DUF488 family)